MITWPICVIAVNLYVHCPLKFLSLTCNTIVNWFYYCLLVSPLSTGDTTCMSTGATIVYWCYHCLLAIPLSLLLLLLFICIQFSTGVFILYPSFTVYSFLPWTRRNLACFFVFIHWNTLQHRTRVYQKDADRISIITGIYTRMFDK